MTQAKRAIRAIADNDRKALRSVVDEAQNSPPLGLSDGSISESVWYALRDLAQAWEAHNDAARRVLNLVNEGKL